MRRSRPSNSSRRRSVCALAAALLLAAIAPALTSCASDCGAKPVASAPAKNTAPADFSYVYPQWQETKDFKRISEYFGDDENTGGDVILRTDNTVRKGLYFRASVPSEIKFPKHSVAVVEYIRGNSPEIQVRSFALPECPTGLFSEVRLGLTGKDWENKDISLVAWRVTLKNPAGDVLAQRQSFLWSIPKSEPAAK